MGEVTGFVNRVFAAVCAAVCAVEQALWDTVEAVPLVGKHARLVVTGLFVYGLGAYVLHIW